MWNLHSVASDFLQKDCVTNWFNRVPILQQFIWKVNEQTENITVTEIPLSVEINMHQRLCHCLQIYYAKFRNVSNSSS